MKNKDKNLVLFLVFLAILMISIPSLNTKKSQEDVDIFNLGTSQVSWNVSEYVNFTGPPIDTAPPTFLEVFRIFIDDDDPSYNWSKTAAENAWCSGSGIAGDPYVIEGLYINAQGVGGGIHIRNTDKHFIVRNCWVNNSGTHHMNAGVLLRTSENGIIQDNIFTYTEKGVYVITYCSNITVSGNYMVSDPSYYGRAFGISNFCNDIFVCDNVIINYYDGMRIANAENVTLKNNYVANFIFDEWEDSPVQFDSVNNSEVIYNTLDGAYSQIGDFVYVYGGTNNTVFNNSIVSDGEFDVPEVPILSGSPKLSASDKTAMDLANCNYNLVAHNRILSSSEAGIPGYDALFILSLFGIVLAALIIKVNIKKSKF